MWINVADTGQSLLILTHLTFSHRLLSSIVNAPEQLWHAGAATRSGLEWTTRTEGSGRLPVVTVVAQRALVTDRKPDSACARRGLAAALTAEASG